MLNKYYCVHLTPASLLTKSKKTIRPQTPTINALIKLIRNLVTKNRIFAPNFQTFL